MFEKAPVRYDELDELNDEEIRRLRKSENRLRRYGRAALYGVALVLSPLTLAHSEVAATMLLDPDTQPSIHYIAEPKDDANSDKTTVFIDGFGSQNGAYFAESLTPAIQAANDSEIYAVEYGNRSVDVDGIASDIAETVPEGNSISLYGYSIGGLVAIKVAIVLKSKYNIDVDEIFLDHTPMDADSVRAKMRSKAQIVLNVINAADKIGIDVEDSYTLRAVAGLAFSDMGDMDATTELMEDQFLVTINANTREDLKKISEFYGIKPTIVYLPSADRSSDYMVDDARSEKEVVDYATADNIPYMVLPVQNAIHSRPDLTVPEYVDAMKTGKQALDASRKQATIRYQINFGGQSRYHTLYK